MIELIRKDNKVYYKGAELKINKQQSKNNGLGDPAVYVGDIEEANGQKWISLKRLVEGSNTIEGKSRIVTSCCNLTQEEKTKIANLEKQIKEIKDNAKRRKVINLKNLDSIDPSKLSKEEAQDIMTLLKNRIKDIEDSIAK